MAGRKPLRSRDRRAAEVFGKFFAMGRGIRGEMLLTLTSLLVLYSLYFVHTHAHQEQY